MVKGFGFGGKGWEREGCVSACWGLGMFPLPLSSYINDYTNQPYQPDFNTVGSDSWATFWFYF